MLTEVRTLRAQGQQVAVIAAALDRMGRDLGESVRARKELNCLPPSVCRSILEAIAERVVHRKT